MENLLIGVILVTTGLLLGAAPLGAHHGGASFDTTKELTPSGTVTQWIWANPHCPEVRRDGRDGDRPQLVVETGNPTDMSRSGWARTSFKVADVVSGHVAAGQERRTCRSY